MRKDIDEIKRFMRKNMGNCPFCESEILGSSAWAISPEGWERLKEIHNKFHKYGEEEKQD